MKNIISDWSGVISDDFYIVFSTANAILSSYGKKTATQKEFRETFDLPYLDFYKSRGINATKEEIDERFEKFRKKFGNANPNPEARKVLEYLKSNAISVIVLTSAPQSEINEEMARYGFSDYFHKVYAGVHDKINALKKIKEGNGFSSGNTLYLDDLPHGMRAGKDAGLFTLGIQSKFSEKRRLRKAGADDVIDNLGELVKVIREII